MTLGYPCLKNRSYTKKLPPEHKKVQVQKCLWNGCRLNGMLGNCVLSLLEKNFRGIFVGLPDQNLPYLNEFLLDEVTSSSSMEYILRIV